MRALGAVAVFALLAGPAFAQKPMQKYGDPDPEKSRTEIEAEKDAERAYQRSLRNVPEAKGAADPWGTVRGSDAQKTAAKPAPAKRGKPAAPQN